MSSRLRRKISKGDTELGQRLRQNLIAEGDLLARFDHPHIVAIIERASLAGGTPYFVMPFHPGSLTEWIWPPGATTPTTAGTPPLLRPAQALGQRQTVAIVRQLLRALAEIHRLGVVHRDIKPNNVLIDRQGDAVLSDFGVAKNPFSNTVPLRRRFGAPPFVSPEQSRDPAATDARTDLYAVGITAHLMLAGELPGDQRPSAEPIPGIDTGLDRWVKRLTEGDAAKRPSDAVAALAQLEEAAARVDAS